MFLWRATTGGPPHRNPSRSSSRGAPSHTNHPSPLELLLVVGFRQTPSPNSCRNRRNFPCASFEGSSSSGGSRPAPAWHSKEQISNSCVPGESLEEFCPSNMSIPPISQSRQHPPPSRRTPCPWPCAHAWPMPSAYAQVEPQTAEGLSPSALLVVVAPFHLLGAAAKFNGPQQQSVSFVVLCLQVWKVVLPDSNLFHCLYGSTRSAKSSQWAHNLVWSPDLSPRFGVQWRYTSPGACFIHHHPVLDFHWFGSLFVAFIWSL